MLQGTRKSATARKPSACLFGALYGTRVLTLTLGAVLLTQLPAHASQQGQQDQQMGSMPGMDMSGGKNGKSGMPEMAGMADMSNMGPSMAAMAGHMYMTPLRPKQPGDEEKAKAVIAQAKATMERYKDWHKALTDGYVIANPKLEQPQYHFTNQANTREADFQFDPSKPTSLLYRRTPTQRYKLEGVMYTARPNTTEDELNRRIPLSIARWHEHIHPHQRGLRSRRRHLLSIYVHLDDPRLSLREGLQRHFLHGRRRSPRALTNTCIDLSSLT
jgi:hypothetical protein